jgi:hypothetical protein
LLAEVAAYGLAISNARHIRDGFQMFLRRQRKAEGAINVKLTSVR